MGSYGDLYAEEGVPSHQCLRQISMKKVQKIGYIHQEQSQGEQLRGN